ncbi:MAG: hypothetical protein IJV15_05440 [Lachnospiraceae bacterium]|nr:hypothetical protein [Lachnospiraceae bacterium]
MKVQNRLAKHIDTAGIMASYDKACKQVLANKIILAWIIKYSTKEYSDYSVFEIAENFIDGEPQISKETVHRDEVPESIEGANNEDSSIKEGVVRFDIKFKAIIPETDNRADMIINVEAQNDFYPGYPIIKRGIYYASRMISSQYETIFTNSHYEKLKKVRSIWICTRPPKKRQNTISRYNLTKEEVFGHFEENMDDYDLISVSIICLNDNKNDSSDKLIQMLSTLLSKTINTEDKKKRLSEEFNIPMTKELEGGVRSMCNLSQGVYDDGFNDGYDSGIEESTINSIKNLIENTDWDIDKCMDILKISNDKREKYKDIILNESVMV